MKAQPPYAEYDYYLTYHSKEGRRYVNLVAKGYRTTVSYARYLIEVKLGRRLTEDEHVDHKDDNKMNDDINNLQILTQLENLKKSNPKKDYGTKICPVCSIAFQATRNKHVKCCSQECGYEFQKQRRGTLIMKPNVVRQGILDMQICVPKEYTDEQVIEAANTLYPCGTKNGWTIRRQGDFYLGGAGERVTCEKYPENVHIMLDA